MPAHCRCGTVHSAPSFGGPPAHPRGSRRLSVRHPSRHRNPSGLHALRPSLEVVTEGIAKIKSLTNEP